MALKYRVEYVEFIPGSGMHFRQRDFDTKADADTYFSVLFEDEDDTGRELYGDEWYTHPSRIVEVDVPEYDETTADAENEA